MKHSPTSEADSRLASFKEP